MTNLQVLMFIVLSVPADLLLGCIVLSAVDRNNELYRWVWSAPSLLLSHLCVLLWPITLAIYLRGGGSDPPAH